MSSLYVITAGVLWGTISIFVSILNSAGFSSMQCVALRAFFTAVMLFVYIMVTDRSKIRIYLNDLWCFLGTGICSIVFFNFCYFKCIELMGSSAVPALLMYTSPVFVMLLSLICFREKITVRKLAATVLVICGLAVVTGAFSGGGNVTPSVVITGLGAGLGYALYSIFGKVVAGKYDSVTITFYTFLVAAIAAIPISGVAGSLGLLADLKALGAILCLSLFVTVLPYILYTKGLSGMEAGKAAVLATVEPVAAAVVGALFFQESFPPSKVAGIVIVLAAIIFLNAGSG